MKPDIQRPSHDEYVSFVEERFRFLEQEYGFRKSWDTQDSFRVAYSNGDLRVQIWGWGWGASGHASLSLGDESLPYHRIVTPLSQRLLATTGKPQLDDLQELAIRFEKQCADLLRGDFTRLLPHRPFPRAEELWHKRDYATLVDRLRKCEVPLSPEWQNRFEYALKNK
jgi:hypothetical protein